MANIVTYEEVASLAAQLPVEDQRRLAQRLLNQASETVPGKRSLMEFCGIAPYPLCGEDAQAWVSRTRREWDEHREKQLRR